MTHSLLLTGPLLVLLAAPALAQSGARQAAAFGKADANGDGVISRAELMARKGAMFDRADRNGDGLIDQAEANRLRQMAKRAAVAAEANAGLSIAAMDVNGDGLLSRSEFTSYLPMFDVADANGDSVLDQGEMTRMRSAIQN
ncbi:EF-hand domain-containing protein [Pseudooceanicola sp. 502str34]